MSYTYSPGIGRGGDVEISDPHQTETRLSSKHEESPDAREGREDPYGGTEAESEEGRAGLHGT